MSDTSPDDALRQELIDGLNTDLAAELQAAIHSLLAAETLTGLDRVQLADLLASEVGDELGHARFLARTIVALGGEPVTEPREVVLGADGRENLAIALAGERDTIARYERRVEQARALGEEGLAIALEDLIVDETAHRDELALTLREEASPSGGT